MNRKPGPYLPNRSLPGSSSLFVPGRLEDFRTFLVGNPVVVEKRAAENHVCPILLSHDLKNTGIAVVCNRFDPNDGFLPVVMKVGKNHFFEIECVNRLAID